MVKATPELHVLSTTIASVDLCRESTDLFSKVAIGRCDCVVVMEICSKDDAISEMNNV